MAPSKPVKCPRCRAAVAMRVNRNGFLQRNVLGHLGIYPWKCGACGSVFLFPRRGHRPRSSGPVPESGHAGHNESS